MSIMLELASTLAVHMHKNQMYGAKPYFFHLHQVAELVQPWGEEAQVIAYLHDALEDTELTLETVHNLFGWKIADCVLSVTDAKEETRELRKAETYRRLGQITEKSDRVLALIVKAADRLANVRMSAEHKNKKMLKMYRNEQEAFVKAVHRKGVNTQFISETHFILSEL